MSGGNTSDALAVIGGGLQDLGGFSGGGHQQYAQENIKANRQTRAARDLGTAIQNGLDPALAVNSYIAAGGDPTTASQIMSVQSQVQKASALKLLGNYMGGVPQPQGGATPQGGASPQPGGPPLPMPVPGQMPQPGGVPAGGYSRPGPLNPNSLPPEIRQALFQLAPDQAISQFLPKAPIKLGKDEGLYSPTGQAIIPRDPQKPEQWKVNSGQDEVTYQMGPNGQPMEVGRAPRSAMEAPKSDARQKQDIAAALAGRQPLPTQIWDEPKLVEVNDGKGGTQQITAQQNRTNGQWATADQNRTPIDATGLRVLNPSQMPGGGRVAGQTGRIMGAGELVTTALENLSKLPASSNFGLLGQAGHPATISGALARTVTPEEAQMYQTVSKGVGRGLAALEAEGLAPSGTFTNSLTGLDIQAGDTGTNALLKLAEQRQGAESSLKAIQKGPLLTKGQQEEVSGLMDRLKTAIPWTPADVIQMRNSKNPGQTFTDLAKAKGLGTQPSTGAPGGKVGTYDPNTGRVNY